LVNQPVHRWFTFPHSFSSELVHALIGEWGLSQGDRVLDPFAGAGTTVLSAKQRSVPATGYDLSPLAVFVTAAKVAPHDAADLSAKWGALAEATLSAPWAQPGTDYPELVRRALPGRLLGTFDAVLRAIDEAALGTTQEAFFRLAVLSLVPEYSRAEANGGWLRWVDKRTNSRSLPRRLANRVHAMIDDVAQADLPRGRSWRARLADARCLPDADGTYSGVITSPPYPNRHDYTRVFGVELMLAFLDANQTKALRYQSLHSHPEAQPTRPAADGYYAPAELRRAIEEVSRRAKDARVPRMLEGYFLDTFLYLRELRRVCKRRARVALVVGNAQYCGVPVMVDELAAEIAEQVGLRCDELRTVRYRGNSAQQMKEFGRHRSRETILILTRP